MCFDQICPTYLLLHLLGFAFMFPRNLRVSKWEEQQKWPTGLYLNYAGPRRGIRVWLESLLSFPSGWYIGLAAPAVIAAH